MKIPVFVSTPTSLSAEQAESKGLILAELDRFGLEPRTLGQGDYSTDLPLREVLVIAKHCAGGVILGFEQLQVTAGIRKRGTEQEKELVEAQKNPTPWNHLEAGVLFSLDLPLLVFREEGITGGVFDAGVTDVFVHRMPSSPLSDDQREGLTGVFLKWQAKVRERYYE